MALKTKQQLVPAGNRFQGSGTNTCEYLTIHQTDNWGKGAGAQAHANLQAGGYKGASWHWQVDSTQAVQSYPETAVCWHAGDGGNGPGNRKSIAIEMCLNPESNYQVALDNLAQLAAQIMRRRGIPMSRLVQHNHWTGKNCPSQIRKNGEWAAFRAKVQGYLNGASSSTKPSTPAPSSGLTVDGYWGSSTTRRLQQVLGTTVDGKVSSQETFWKKDNPGLTSGWQWVNKPVGSRMIVAMQKRLGVKADGMIGPATINALSKRYGIKGDGKLDAGSITIKAMQRKLNQGGF